MTGAQRIFQVLEGCLLYTVFSASDTLIGNTQPAQGSDGWLTSSTLKTYTLIQLTPHHQFLSTHALEVNHVPPRSWMISPPGIFTKALRHLLISPVNIPKPNRMEADLQLGPLPHRLAALSVNLIYKTCGFRNWGTIQKAKQAYVSDQVPNVYYWMCKGRKQGPSFFSSLLGTALET